MVIMDGSLGLLLADPNEKTVTYFAAKKNQYLRKRRELNRIKDALPITACGTHITLQANIETEEDIRALRQVNATGVGLYRTEFLYLNRKDLPSEEEHYKNYLKIVRALKGAPLTIRTVDLGADKETQQQKTGSLIHNPALGLRGIRRCLSEPGIFIPQLRAILRAATKGPINILLPMLTKIEEVLQLQRLIQTTQQALLNDGYKFAQNIPLGGMIEVPAAAIAATQFAQHLDFFSIGTNDLIQYTLAIDRIDDQVNYLYDPLHPGILNLIAMTIKAGNKAGIPVSMCGEMAGDQRYTRLLLALGLRNFSMPANSILEVKSIINHSNLDNLSRKARKIANCTDPLIQTALLEKLNSGCDLLEI